MYNNISYFTSENIIKTLKQFHPEKDIIVTDHKVIIELIEKYTTITAPLLQGHSDFRTQGKDQRSGASGLPSTEVALCQSN